MILVIDNYDSFVFNIARYVEELGHETQVDAQRPHRRRSASLASGAAGLIISPGPCTPNEAGVSTEAVRTPVRHDADPRHLPRPSMHRPGVRRRGDACRHADARPRLDHPPRRQRPVRRPAADVPRRPLPLADRLVDYEDAPELEACAWSEDGEVMAIRHRKHPTFGVQFHPESVLTEHGYDLLGAFLEPDRGMSGDPVWVNGSLRRPDRSARPRLYARRRRVRHARRVQRHSVRRRAPSGAACRPRRGDRHSRSTRSASARDGTRCSAAAKTEHVDPAHDRHARRDGARPLASRAARRRPSSSRRRHGTPSSSAGRCGSSSASIRAQCRTSPVVAPEDARLPRQCPRRARGRRAGAPTMRCSSVLRARSPARPSPTCSRSPDRKLLTPPIADGVMPGIMRALRAGSSGHRRAEPGGALPASARSGGRGRGLPDQQRALPLARRDRSRASLCPGRGASCRGEAARAARRERARRPAALNCPAGLMPAAPFAVRGRTIVSAR